MALRQVVEVYDLLDSAQIDGQAVAALLNQRGLRAVEVRRLKDAHGETDFLKIIIPGTNGKDRGGNCRTLGIICHLGGIGVRPHAIGLVSDADGAIAAVATALKLADMGRSGDRLCGDVIITTQICPRAPVHHHDPVSFVSCLFESGTNRPRNFVTVCYPPAVSVCAF
jgi:hypothetical protein